MQQNRYEKEHGRRGTVGDSVEDVPSTMHDGPDVVQSSEPRRSSPSRAQAGIARTTDGHDQDTGSRSRNPITRAARGVRRAISKLTRRDDVQTPVATVPERPAEKPARLPRRETDIPMDEIASAYTPAQTSLKTSFRSDGRDRQSDQEYANGAADSRWNDEDRITNKSGDPRIGTHGRTYEAGERNTAPVANKS